MCTLHSPRQAMMLDLEKLDGMMVQIEDDNNGNMHAASIIDFFEIGDRGRCDSNGIEGMSIFVH